VRTLQVAGSIPFFGGLSASIEVDRKAIYGAEDGQSVGLKLGQLAHVKDAVFKKLKELFQRH
jgi:hypothetical protein